MKATPDELAPIENNVYTPAAPGFYKVEVVSAVNLDEQKAESGRILPGGSESV